MEENRYYYDILTEEDNKLLKEFEILKKYKNHNIIKERVELYKIFVENLTYYITSTYLGKEYITTKKDIDGHFNWCYGKVCSEFYEIEIDFYDNNELYDYLLLYFETQFYSTTAKTYKQYRKFWNDIFDYEKKNTKTLDVLIEVYEIFDISLYRKEENKIYDIFF